MKRRILTKLVALAACASATTFQATGCGALTGDELTNSVNSATQGFFNSLWAQWSGVKVDGVFNVD